MIVYNITLSIHPEIETDVLVWLKEEHIPEVMETGLFLKSNMYKVIEDHVKRTHNSYAVQYVFEDWKKLEIYEEKHAEVLRNKTKEKFGDNVLVFRTFLEKI